MPTNFCELVQEKAEQLPDNIAVKYLDSSLSYHDLEKLSSLFARQLIQMGIRSGDIIGVGLFNSIYLIVGILGVMKAGGVYLPLDPNYPNIRTNQMVSDANAKLVILDDQSKSCFEDIQVDKCYLDINNFNPIPIKLPIISSKQPAYIVYTSGSTGTPKGIVVSHSSLKYAASSFAKVFPFPPCSLLPGSISFDPSILVICHALVTGGTVCLYDNREGIDLKEFTQITKILNKSKVDFILSTPSFYNHILKQREYLCSLKNILLCGEKIHSQLIHDHIFLAPQANLYNTYGPSEYAIGSTIALIYDSFKKKQHPVTIGKPFCDNKIYVLDNELNLVPKGIKGEIFVGGPGIAMGYLNQKSLTDEKFLSCNHLGNQSVKLYRTGDIGYQMRNGNFVFTGRRDFQVKIHGHRVELNEIESIIMGYTGIEKAVATVKDQLLIAFYSKNSNSLNLNCLKKDLELTLPSYMIPQVFVEIQTWPINCNGKVDRKALIDHWRSRRTIASFKAS